MSQFIGTYRQEVESKISDSFRFSAENTVMRSGVFPEVNKTSPCLCNAVDYSGLMRSIEDLREQAAILFLEALYDDGLSKRPGANDLKKLINKISAFEDLLEDR